MKLIACNDTLKLFYGLINPNLVPDVIKRCTRAHLRIFPFVFLFWYRHLCVNGAILRLVLGSFNFNVLPFNILNGSPSPVIVNVTTQQYKCRAPFKILQKKNHIFEIA